MAPNMTLSWCIISSSRSHSPLAPLISLTESCNYATRRQHTPMCINSLLSYSLDAMVHTKQFVVLLAGSARAIKSFLVKKRKKKNRKKR
mmetsp:Transcript_49146/g.81675  ORF Transcript_49146/g.81675 Transcript_49146/m.81675 type:complete len:89 (-) Transcript_49146:119-385(-)